MAQQAHRMHTERVFDAISSGAAARSALIASWERSARLHKLDPSDGRRDHVISAEELVRARDAMGRLFDLAGPNLDRLFRTVGGVGCSVLFADRHGVPVDRRGTAGEDGDFRAWGLWTGTIWSEAAEGTNGIGTCLAENRPVVIHRDQHFHARNAGLSCISSPIYDECGRLAGAIDVSSCQMGLREEHAHLIAVAVADAARRIESEHFRAAFPGARVLVAEAGEPIGLSLLAVDRHDLVIGATRAARQAFRLTQAMLDRNVPAQDLLDHDHGGAENFSHGEKAVVHRAIARAEGNISAAARALGISRATLHRKLQRLKLHS